MGQRRAWRSAKTVSHAVRWAPTLRTTTGRDGHICWSATSRIRCLVSINRKPDSSSMKRPSPPLGVRACCRSAFGVLLRLRPRRLSRHPLGQRPIEGDRTGATAHPDRNRRCCSLQCRPEALRQREHRGRTAVLTPPIVARGAAYADFDHDGDLDVVLTTNHGPAYLFPQ